MSEKHKHESKPEYKGQCHTGIVSILTHTGILYAGGWSKSAYYTENMAVIDLTGNEKPASPPEVLYNTDVFAKFLKPFEQPCYEWLSLPLKDFAVPSLKLKDWKNLAEAIDDILKSGHDVLLACQGGHGRTGIAVSIIGYILNNGKDWESPVEHVRKIYCENAVDNEAQENYVYDVLGLKLKADPDYYKPAWSNPIVPPWGQWNPETHSWDKVEKAQPAKTFDAKPAVSFRDCPICHHVKNSESIKRYGMCSDCQKTNQEKLETQAKILGKDIHDLQIMKADGYCICGKKSCTGIFMATCGHVVHNQPQAFKNICDGCYFDQEQGATNETNSHK